MRIGHPPQLNIADISLRQLERADLGTWYSYLQLPSVVEHTSWNLQSSQDLMPMFDSLESTSSESIRRMAVIDNASNELIGTIGFHTISERNRTAEIAYDLAPSHWGRGIARVICSAVTQWGFEVNNWVRIQAVVLETNLRSAAVLKACGYQPEGLLRAYRMVRGTPRDFVVYSRLATDT
ncbi:GNAT family N-acetyltransferase [Pandoraea iniqua]|uniref:GNAT family N-acetyltransferase n=1 Tax=Pandoraea iniqua TaxID=2508288 RepID=A0A5E4YTP9_9BURK|nr:GNAT family protein [Pandoraea iniqua]VVE51263.1 GNAT family N-acetyltransferase [Pandoraea iniqua]